MSRLASVAVLLALAVADVHAAYPPRDVPSTFPHDYPGKPSGDFSPAWQSCMYARTHGSPFTNGVPTCSQTSRSMARSLM